MLSRLILLILTLNLSLIRGSSVRNALRDHERVVRQVSLQDFFSFVSTVIRQSQAMRELLSPIFIRMNVKAHKGPDAVAFKGIEVRGLDKLFVQGSPKLVYTTEKNAIFDASLVAKYIEVGLNYKLGRLPESVVVGHVDQITIQVTLVVPLAGGGSPRATRFKIAQLQGYKLTAGNPVFIPFAGSSLIANALIGELNRLGETAINGILSQFQLPEAPLPSNSTKTEL